MLSGCGGSGGGTNFGYRFGERLGTAVYMSPAPPAHTFLPFPGVGPDIRVDSILQLTSTVHPDKTPIYQVTSQVVFGRVAGSTAGKKVVVYSHTDDYYIQPLTSTTIDIRSDGTWIAPANSGKVHVLLVDQYYNAPQRTAVLPLKDGVNIFAIATQP